MSLILKAFGASDDEYQYGTINDPRLWTTTRLYRDTLAGTKVTEASGLTLTTYFAAGRAVAEDTAKLPLYLYKRDGEDRDKAVDHPVYKVLLDRPAPGRNAIGFWEAMIFHAENWGNSFAEITRNGRGDIESLWLIHPSRVEIRYIDNRPVYWVHPDAKDRGPNEVVPFEEDRIFHLHGLGGDGRVGYSIASLAAEDIGLGLSQQKFASAFFGNGAHADVVLTHPNSLGQEAMDNLRDSWDKAYRGPGKSHKTIILEEEMKFERITIPPNDAQFLESRQFQIEEICRWFRVPPVKVGHNTNTPYANISDLNRAYVTDALQPWMVRISQEVSLKLLRERERREYVAEHDARVLLRGDHGARATFYRTMSAIGTMSINDIRREEGLPPIKNGDVYFIQQNMTTIDKVAEGENLGSNTPTPPGEPGRPSNDDPEADPTDNADAEAAVRPMVFDACDRMLRKECLALAKASKRYEASDAAFTVWAADFYPKHHEHMRESVAPAVAAWRALGRHAPDTVLDGVIGRHCAAGSQRRHVDADADTLTDIMLAALKEADYHA